MRFSLASFQAELLAGREQGHGLVQAPASARRAEQGAPQTAARRRPLLSSHARNTDAVTSYVEQNAGHQPGTPGLEMILPWARSKTPWAASAPTTSQSDDRKPATASARKTAPTSDSRTSARVDSPMTANRT